jgi:hypothetical protein
MRKGLILAFLVGWAFAIVISPKTIVDKVRGRAA